MRAGLSALASIILSLKSVRSHPLWLGSARWAFTMLDCHGSICAVAFLAAALGGFALMPHIATARDLDGRYANSPLKSWFEGLHSSKGPCCSDADGTALSDIDWEMKDGHYRVRIEDQWWDVPDDAVITEPNRSGRTMVWPVYYRELNKWLRVEVRCFMPGSMT
jgi:hypothetical protein